LSTTWNYSHRIVDEEKPLHCDAPNCDIFAVKALMSTDYKIHAYCTTHLDELERVFPDAKQAMSIYLKDGKTIKNGKS